MHIFAFITIIKNFKLVRGALWSLYKTKSFASFSGKPENSNKETPNSGTKNSIPLIFNSLDKGYDSIQFSLLGVAGVYMLINKINPQRFYIGSSTNLSRLPFLLEV